MKRNNPDTGKPFVRGDVRADGHKFYKYETKRVNAEGFFYESWLSPASFAKQKEQARKHQAETYVRKSHYLPREWKEKLGYRKYWIENCRKVYKLLRKKQIPLETLEHLCVVPQIFALLKPFASDYGN